MPGPFSIVVMLPETIENRVDFMSREFQSIEEIATLLHEVESHAPDWRIVAFCHVEDLPLLMESPPGWEPT